MRWPNGTDDGHAASHPRHCTHASIVSANASSIGAPSSCDRAHRRDAPARRRDLEAGDPVRRAVRQAQAARDARDQLVLVETRGGCTLAHDVVIASHLDRRGSTVARGRTRSRPGCELAVGIERGADPRAMSAAFGSAHAEAVEARVRRPRAAATRRGVLRAHRGRGRARPRRRRRRARCRRRPRPASARRRCRASSWPERATAVAGHRDAAAVRPLAASGGRVGTARAPRRVGRSPSTSAAMPSSSTWVVAAVPERSRRAEAPLRDRRAGRPRSCPTTTSRGAAGSAGSPASSTPSVPSDPTSSRGRS